VCLVSAVPFTSREKEFIFEWVGDHLNSNKKTIPWKILQSKMKENFGILRSRNDIKNIWNTRRRQMDKHARKNVNHVNHVNNNTSIITTPLFENYFPTYNSYFFQPSSYPETADVTTESAVSDMILMYSD
jgi:hypothetical protein